MELNCERQASGKLCGHSDMGATYVSRTGLTYSHKFCNKRGLYGIRQLIEQIYNKQTMTVPADELAKLVALGKKGSTSGTSTPSSGGSTTPSGGGSSTPSGGGSSNGDL